MYALENSKSFSKRGEAERGNPPTSGNHAAATSSSSGHSPKLATSARTESVRATPSQGLLRPPTVHLNVPRQRRMPNPSIRPKMSTMESSTSLYSERHLLPRGLALHRFDSTTSVFSWDNTEDTAGPIRLALRRIKYFVFQNDPDRDTDEPFSVTYRYLPILSGCISPFAILLEIPGLTEHWDIRHNSDQTITNRRNPTLLDIAMGFSMACAIIANAALVVRFLEHRIKLMTMICIFFLIIHDMINLSTIIGYGAIFKSEHGFTFGEAFWMVVCSTICSIVVTMTLAFDLITTPAFARSGSGLTRKQRSLVIIVMILISYIALGSLIFSEILNLSFQDGLYFTVVTIETIGFGDITPKGTGSTILCILYATTGWIIIGLTVTVTRDTIMEGFQTVYHRRSQEVSRRRDEHRIQRAKNRAKRLLAIGRETAELEDVIPTRPRSIGAPSPTGILEAVGQEDQIQITQTAPSIVLTESDADDVSHTQSVFDCIREAGATEESYIDFKKRIKKEERIGLYIKLGVTFTLFFLFWSVGAGIFVAAESWSFGRSLYFCWAAFSTVGYGEITPKTPAGRAIFVVWALMGVAMMTILISVLSDAYSSRYQTALTNHKFTKVIQSFDEKSQMSLKADPEADPRPNPSSSKDRDDNHPSEKTLMDSPNGTTRSDEQQPQASGSGCKSIQTLDLPSELATKILTERRCRVDCIPQEVLRYARFFHENIGYFTQAPCTTPGVEKEPMPKGFNELLDEIAESERMDEKMKQEMLGDEDAKRALFFMTYDRAFRRLLDNAEEAVRLIASKDAEWEHLVDVLTQREMDDEGNAPRPDPTASPSASTRKHVQRPSLIHHH
ncbi:hypothetical protein FRB94_006709 [Tulasnella sp. JGI-2019a]|nr:hypothetical protein FRB94_006709 [Tulasnella sp. JGI-2019a]